MTIKGDISTTIGNRRLRVQKTTSSAIISQEHLSGEISRFSRAPDSTDAQG